MFGHTSAPQTTAAATSTVALRRGRRTRWVVMVLALAIGLMGLGFVWTHRPAALIAADPDLAQQVNDARARVSSADAQASGRISVLLGLVGGTSALADGVVDANPAQIFLTPSDPDVQHVVSARQSLRDLDAQAAAVLDPGRTVLGARDRVDWPKAGMAQVTTADVQTLVGRLFAGATGLDDAVASATDSWQRQVVAAAAAERDAAAQERDQAVAAGKQLADALAGVANTGDIVATLRAGIAAAQAVSAGGASDGTAPVSTILAQTQELRTAAATAQAQRPATGAGPLERWVEVSIAKQQVYLHVGGTVVDTFTVSTGKPGHETPTGAYLVSDKFPSRTYSSDKPGDTYYFPDVKWSVRFDGPYLFHTAYWHDDFGSPVSHGCVNMREPEAHVLYDFVTAGTPVVIH
ncbi:MAG: L,D-transpeptidase [Propionibacteriaceae bacterium]|nr:L,D-transpeptidase [Propionibacteriaceae bacterium]